MSSKEEKVSALIADCRRYNLAGLSFVLLFPLKDICAAYNGIGPEWLHPTLRKAVDHLAPDLRPVALIHDVRFTYGDGSVEWFNKANDELEANGLSLANQKYRWYNPMRYITRHRIRVYATLCRLFGWDSFTIACTQTKAKTLNPDLADFYF